MKYRACISHLLAKSTYSHIAIDNLRKAGYSIVRDVYQIYIECDSPESAELVECLNSNI